MRIATSKFSALFKGITAALALVAAPCAALASDIAGSWSGSGSIMMPSGSRENARCNVSYSKAGGAGYTAFATCATRSARVTQSAKLRRVGGNAYEGSFHNSEYNVSGSMSVTVSGSSQSVHLSGGGGEASFRLSRR
ncbi:MAG: hypothetical protein ABL908_13695 [Hyphomicrobium sp.]